MPSLPIYEAAEQEMAYANFLIDTAAAVGEGEGGAVYNEISEQYRKIGVSVLLIDGDLDGFAHHLISSALTRRAFLRQPAPSEAPDHGRRASFLDPVHDAIAVGQVGLAAEIGRLSPDTWYEGYEYLEDFLYAQILFGLVDPGTRDLAALVEQHEEALRGVDDPRNAVCRALVAEDAVAFGEAMEAFVTAEADRIAEARTTSYKFYDFQEISVEGLALLRLARRAGLPSDPEYRHCPSWALRDDYAPYVPESFPNADLDG